MANQGHQAHFRALNALEALVHEYWNIDLVKEVKEELEQAVQLLTLHLDRVACPCGDTEKDVQFYQSLLKLVNEALQERSLFPIPQVQESLETYFAQKTSDHRCIWRLLHNQHDWAQEMETG
ncbi:hypothetical protein [Paludifilum halophilum]|uniref:Uncharacterized protein n=1 Tax=Paludifilum halophilum TaxID=1642702 RepID=A0A235B7T1_9BACL|nr:hypothetical protein [Paludifilum halophilum]OYD08364.1 hypothetical protein CHM34_05845 [Paludifilum halophilum]